jgi:hypothetical protein
LTVEKYVECLELLSNIVYLTCPSVKMDVIIGPLKPLLEFGDEQISFTD